MPKAILEFNLPEEQEEFDTACKADSMAAAIDEVSNQVFRPARKHGYQDEAIQKIVESSQDVRDVIELLEKKFYEILNDYGVNR